MHRVTIVLRARSVKYLATTGEADKRSEGMKARVTRVEFAFVMPGSKEQRFVKALQDRDVLWS